MPEFKPSIALAPSDTLAAFDRRTELVQSVRWSELMYADHAFGFTMAKLHKLELLAKVRAAVRSMIADGGTPRQIMAGLIPELQKSGWWGVVMNKELTGTNEPVLINEQRIKNMLRINLRVSRSAGQWANIQALKSVAPYLGYYAIDDDVTRPDHRLWGGLDTGKPIILPVDHPLWLTHYPPNGWGCRCLVQQFSADDLDRRGLTVTTDDDLKAMGLMSADGQIAPVKFIFNAANGEDYPTPSGIDAGFAYNPGIENLRAAAFHTSEVLAEIAVTDFDAATLTLKELVESPDFEAFINTPAARFPVTLIGDEMKSKLGVQSQVVLLSPSIAASRIEQLGQAAAIAQIRTLPTMLDKAIRIIKSGDDLVIFFRDEVPGMGSELLRAVIRKPESGSALEVTDLVVVSSRQMAAQSRAGEVIFSSDGSQP